MIVDDLDKKILDVLQRNSRLSSRKIATLLNVSPSTVGERIKTLQDKGIIRRFTIQVDPEGLGLECSLLIQLKTAPGRDIAEVSKAVSEIKEICYIYQVTGGFNLVLVSRASNREKAL
ncbi:MAG: Lrp/AsnC family transcriptional regulator [Nitrospinota bacterium]